MKPLILSFFAIILGYSLFIDKDEEVKLSVPEQHTNRSSMESQNMSQKHDSINFYAERAEKKISSSLLSN